ncbi:hypothetical protein JMJ77_0002600, partial [Colletotrichum scovillei]
MARYLRIRRLVVVVVGVLGHSGVHPPASGMGSTIGNSNLFRCGTRTMTKIAVVIWASDCWLSHHACALAKPQRQALVMENGESHPIPSLCTAAVIRRR